MEKVATAQEPFVGRNWVFRSLETWIADTGVPRFFLIAGAPGSGKTAFIRELEQCRSRDGENKVYPRLESAVSAVHFCTARRSTSIEPMTFVRSISKQLANCDEHFREALLQSSEGNMEIKVVQNVTTAHHVTGVYVNNIVLSGLSPRRAFTCAVVAPLQIMQANAPRVEPMLLVVDGLDESRSVESPSITDLLASTDDLPPWVKILVTSRPYDDLFADLLIQRTLSLSSSGTEQENAQDLLQYIRLRLGDSAHQRAAIDVEQAASVVAGRAAGNFLYAKLFLDDVEAGRLSLDSIDSLPTGLDAYFYQSVKRGVQSMDGAWSSSSGPVFGLLAVAREPLSQEQIQRVLTVPPSTLLQFLLTFAPLISRAATPNGAAVYALFHQSFRDFLRLRNLSTDANVTILNPYFLEVCQCHEGFLRYYLSQGVSGIDSEDIDDYGLRHLPFHLAEAGRDGEIPALVSGSFLTQKADRFHDYRLIREDLRKGMTAASGHEDARAAFRLGMAMDLMRYHFGTDLPREIAPLYALAGEVERAIDLAEIAAADWVRTVALRNIVAAIGARDPESALQVAKRQVSTEGQCESLVLVLLAYLENRRSVEECLTLAQQIIGLAELSSSNPAWQCLIYRDLVVALERVSGEQANSVFAQGVARATQIGDPQQRCLALLRLSEVRAKGNPQEAAYLLGRSLDALEKVDEGEWRAKEFGRLITKLASMDLPDALHRSRTFQDRFSRCIGLASAARLVAASSLQEAEALLEEAVQESRFISIARVEGYSWIRKAEEVLGEVRGELPRIAAGEVAPPSVEPEELMLSLFRGESKQPEEALLRGISTAMEDPSNDPLFVDRVVACLSRGRKQDALELLQARVHSTLTSSSSGWRTRLVVELLRVLARSDLNKAIALVDESPVGGAEALAAIIEVCGQSDLPRAMTLLDRLSDSDWRTSISCIAHLAVEAARRQAVEPLCLLLGRLFKTSGAKASGPPESLDELEVLLGEFVSERWVIGASDVVCDTLAIVSSHLVSSSPRTAACMLRAVLAQLDGEHSRIEEAIDHIGKSDAALAIDLAKTACAAYRSKSFVTRGFRSVGVLAAVRGLAPHAPDIALSWLDDSIQDSEPEHRALGYSRLARVFAASDQARSQALLSTARSEANRVGDAEDKLEALLGIARDCVGVDNSSAQSIVESVLVAARGGAVEDARLGLVLAQSSEVLLAIGARDEGARLIEKATDGMEETFSGSALADAILHAALEFGPEIAHRIGLRLLLVLSARDAWGEDTPLLTWAHDVARLLVADGDCGKSAAIAKDLLEELDRADKLREAILIGCTPALGHSP